MLLVAARSAASLQFRTATARVAGRTSKTCDTTTYDANSIRRCLTTEVVVDFTEHVLSAHSKGN